MKYIWHVLLLLACAGLRAQQQAPLQIPGKWDFRFNPMGLVDVLDGNLSVGLERHLNKRWSITTDLSLILYSAYIPENKRALGYIIKPAVRFYTSEERSLFLEVSLFYKHAGYKIKDWLGKDCVNGVPAYEALETFVFRKRVVGINGEAGWRKNLTRNKLLRIELYVGLGIRTKRQDIKNDAQACYQTTSIYNTEINQTNFTGGSIPHGLRLVYSIQ